MSGRITEEKIAKLLRVALAIYAGGVVLLHLPALLRAFVGGYTHVEIGGDGTFWVTERSWYFGDKKIFEYRARADESGFPDWYYRLKFVNNHLPKQPTYWQSSDGPPEFYVLYMGSLSSEGD